uniref:ATP-dependent DNA helicase n=1 Tax=Tanacetum cinerariifolium TaxID=118510 RepID=A0A6L2J794_TANCI|nr:hypothetical protein [Tanacetum cinerariifolium]
MLNMHNPLVQSFRMAKDRFVQSSIQPVTLCLFGTRQRTGRQYNLPTASEVVALIPGDGNPIESRDVIVEEHGRTLHKASCLFHTFCVDAYTVVLDHDLDWYKRNQHTIRSKLYNGLHDHITNGETNAKFLGQKNVLPSTFTSGPRHMIQQYQDAMAICRWVGPLDLFVTMTCNPKWPEIQREVESCIPGQPTVDRPDTIARVFKMKLDDLMEDIRKGNHFQRLKAGAYCFQKRGLPHCHSLIFLHEHDKISSTDEINHVISAELPYEIDDPIAFNAVRSHMMHGPCGELYKSASCMSRDTCVKGFPKQYCKDTFITRDGWPHYRRPNNGTKVQVGRQNFMLDNRNIGKVSFSYLNKGPDRATVVIEGQRNETNNSTTATNISNTTYSSRMTTTNNTTPTTTTANTTTTTNNNNNNNNNNNTRMIRNALPTVAVERFHFHEEGCNRVYFRGDDDVDNVIQRETATMSKFTEWMKANEMYPEIGSNLTLIAAERMYNANEEWSRFTSLLDNPNVDNQVFDGKVVVLGGDFRQILPVILNASRVVVVSSVVDKSSSVWDYCKVFVLSINMRLRDPKPDVTNTDEIMRFHNWLIAMGDGRLLCIALDGEADATWITIPEDLLTPIDDNPVEAIVSNNLEDMQIMYAPEFINTLRFSGVPNHKLELKIGAPIILLRNTGLQRGNKVHYIWNGVRYKLVIRVQDDGEEIECVLFNSEVTPLLGITIEELFYKTIIEGAGDPDWIVDYLINHLYTQWVVLQIKIDNSGSVENMVYSDLSISSQDSYWDTTDYAIHDENLGSTISKYEEKLMDELKWGQDVSILKPAATHICMNEVPHAPDTSTNDFSMNEPNKGKSIVDAEPVVVETHLNNFTHDESLSLPELASDVNKDVSPLSSPTIEQDEMPTSDDEDKMMISVDEAAINQHVDIMQDV